MTNDQNVTYVDDEKIDMIVRTNEDGTRSFIPKDEANSDYQAYVEWLKDA